MSKELKFLIELVKEATKLITDEFKVKIKDEKGDVVTNFDYEIEKYMIDKIKKKYPSFSIISEEFNNKNELTDNCFTIDPIDGTINFANNIPLWGIQVACIKDKKVCASVIYLPKLNELYYADDNGAFLNGNPIKVNDLEIKNGIFTIEGPWVKKLKQTKNIYPINIHNRNFYCNAINYAYVASGKISAANFIMDSVWDYIPGEYLVEKAGGVIFNDKNIHIAANNEEFLNLLKEAAKK